MAWVVATAALLQVPCLPGKSLSDGLLALAAASDGGFPPQPRARRLQQGGSRRRSWNAMHLLSTLAVLPFALPLAVAADDGVLAARRAVAATWPEAQVSSAIERLPCDGTVSADPPQDARMGITQVRLRCAPANGSPGWSRFISLKVSAPDQVAVLTRAVAQGQPVTADSLRFEPRDRFLSPANAIRSSEALQAQTARRDLAAGSVLTNDLLVPPKVIARGQSVTLLSTGGGMQVSAPGEALADAVLGGHVRVRNSSSQRVVEGIARADGVVEVSL